MARVLLEGIYRIWVDVDAKEEWEAFDKVNDMTTEEIFNGATTVPIREIEDLEPVEFEKDEED